MPPYKISLPKSLLLPDLLNPGLHVVSQDRQFFHWTFFSNKRFHDVISATPNGTESVGAGESRVEKEE